LNFTGISPLSSSADATLTVTFRHATEVPILAALGVALEQEHRPDEAQLGQRNGGAKQREHIDPHTDMLRARHHGIGAPRGVGERDIVGGQPRLERKFAVEVAVDDKGTAELRAHVAGDRPAQPVPVEQGDDHRHQGGDDDQDPGGSGDLHGRALLCSLFESAHP
jgi:hypothetical protein